MSTHIINFPGADIHTTTLTSVSNVSVGENLDVHGTANVGVLSATLPLATVASNLVTYDTATGQLLDSNGLVSNKLSIVSEQPPAALTGDSTVVDGHGRYKVTSSSEGSEPDFGDWNCFNKVTGSATSAWSSDQTYDTVTFLHDGTQSIGGIDGEWVKLELPYKTRLRHISLQARSEGDIKQLTPGTFSIIGSNDDSSWTLLKQITGVAASDYSSATQKQFVIDASASYKYYALVVEKIVGGSYASTNPRAIIGEWRLFTETFTVDAGVVSTTAASGLDVGYTEHPVEPMKDYHTYVEGHGTYEASASNVNSTLYPWQAFDHVAGSVTRWTIASPSNQYNTTTGEWDQAAITAYPNIYTDDVGGTRYAGHWLQIKLPYAITLSHSNVHPTNGYGLDRAPKDGVILGSNDGEHWYKLTEFTGKAYSDNTWTRIDVNATTSYQYYRMCITKVVGGTYGSYSELTEWRLFAEKPVTRMENVHISGDLSSETLQTGYIKWPKVPLKAAESEGYVASASNVYPGSTNYLAFRAFDDQTTFGTGTAYAWITGPQTFDATDGTVDSSNAVTFDSLSCHWIQLQSPQAFAVSHFDFDRRESEGYSTIIPQETPKEGYLYASNDGVDWTRIQSFSDLPKLGPHDWHRVDVENSTPYTYYRLVVTKIHPGNTAGYCGVSNLRFFEAATGVGGAPTSAKLQVAGSLGMAKGSEFFAGDDVVMELPKHDRPLVKYPEIPITSSSTIDGYTATASSYNIREAWQAFDSSDVTSWTSSSSFTGSPLTGDEYLQLELPVAIKVVKMYIKAYASSSYQNSPRDAELLGSNDGVTWNTLNTSTDLPLEAYGASTWVNVNATQYYKFLRLRITKSYDGLGNWARVADLQFWGHEEGDTSVDVVHRSVPNKPGQQHLEVYWDANDSNSYSFADSSSVYDLSGSGVKGTITGNNGFDAEYNAWVFDGSGDYISTTHNLGTGGQPVHSMSIWFKNVDPNPNYVYVAALGGAGYAQQSTIQLVNDKIRYTKRDYAHEANNSFVNNTWVHVVTTYSGGDFTQGNCKLYIDGVEAAVTSSGTGTPSTFTVATNSLYLGARTDGSGGQFDGSIANFRLFSKALSADQVRELYDYDAERFGHRQNLVALHKGNLGVGVAHPTSRFEVAGTETLQEYPPRAIRVFDYDTHIESHGVFNFYSSQSDNTYFGNSNWNFTRVFANGITDRSTAWHGDGGLSSPGMYQAVAVYAPAVTSGDGVRKSTLKDGSVFFGEWIEMHSPSAINITNVVINSREYYGKSRGIGKFVILGSNDGHSWEQAGYGAVAPHDNSSGTDAGGYGVVSDEKATKVSTNSNGRFYTHHRLVVTHIMGSRAATNHPQYGIGKVELVNVAYLRFLGTPAPSGLEDGHLTLGKALTAPRFTGHAAGAETPRAESLVVHYDTTVDSVVAGSTVVDTSGNGVNGVLTDGASYSSSERALTFDGASDQYIYVSNAGNGSGNWSHSVSFWLKPEYDGTGNDVPFRLGPATNNKSIGFYYNSTQIAYYFYGNDYAVNKTLSNQWYHITLTYDGTTRSIYVDGTLFASSSSGGGLLNLDGNNYMHIGSNQNNSAPMTGSISNFKLWGGVALTADEVAAEYALGRTGKSLNVTDTAVCIGGTVPRAQLDVRGSLHAPGVILNTIQYIDSTNRSTTSNAPVAGYETPWTSMKANSKVNVDVHIPYRNDGTGWGGSYHLIYMMVNQPVGTVPANTWVLLSNSGYHMTYYQDIMSYTNSYYIPLSVSSDFSIRFRHDFRVYNSGTLYINQSHDISRYLDNNLLQFGVSQSSAGWTKFIVQEIGG
jgi:hypothetical protein